jgi:hypothetical protein
LLHVLPDGFMRVRHFGFLANRSKKQSPMSRASRYWATAITNPQEICSRVDARCDRFRPCAVS